MRAENGAEVYAMENGRKSRMVLADKREKYLSHLTWQEKWYR